jgi:hypothetical protein
MRGIDCIHLIDDVIWTYKSVYLQAIRENIDFLEVSVKRTPSRGFQQYSNAEKARVTRGKDYNRYTECSDRQNIFGFFVSSGTGDSDSRDGFLPGRQGG